MKEWRFVYEKYGQALGIQNKAGGVGFSQQDVNSPASIGNKIAKKV